MAMIRYNGQIYDTSRGWRGEGDGGIVGASSEYITVPGGLDQTGEREMRRIWLSDLADGEYDRLPELQSQYIAGSGMTGGRQAREQDAVNLVARMSPDALARMAAANGMDDAAAQQAIAAINANRAALADDSPGAVDAWRESTGIDPTALMNATFKQVQISPGTEDRPGQWGYAINPAHADGIKPKYGGGFRDYGALDYDPTYGVVNPNDAAGVVKEREKRDFLTTVAPMAMGFFAGPMLASALGATAGGALTGAAMGGVTGGDPVRGALTGGIGGAFAQFAPGALRAAGVTDPKAIKALTMAGSGMAGAALGNRDPVRGGLTGLLAGYSGVPRGLLNAGVEAIDQKRKGLL